MTDVEKGLAMRTIALEEHYATPAFMDGPGRHLKDQARTMAGDQVIGQLSDVGDGRIAAMDAAGIDVQVLSLTAPGVEQLDPPDAITLAREANDHLADAIHHNPTRLAGFAALPTPAPHAAADELQRTIDDHGFVGAMINGHSRGRYLDDEFFWPILQAAEALEVPLYLHPTPPPQAVIEAAYTGNYPPHVAGTLATVAWGWHIDTATHILRLILSGAFDRYPRLQLIIGHMGEGLSFMLPRIEATLSRVTNLDRPIGDYFRDNLHYTFAAFNWTPTFLNLLLHVGVDRIMFATDHPYAPMTTARTFLDHLPVSPTDKERIAHTNAERLLRL
jgi:predicted TIM-barrel fold metal-dependent hydrolase